MLNKLEEFVKCIDKKSDEKFEQFDFAKYNKSVKFTTHMDVLRAKKYNAGFYFEDTIIGNDKESLINHLTDVKVRLIMDNGGDDVIVGKGDTTFKYDNEFKRTEVIISMYLL